MQQSSVIKAWPNGLGFLQLRGPCNKFFAIGCPEAKYNKWHDWQPRPIVLGHSSGFQGLLLSFKHPIGLRLMRLYLVASKTKEFALVIVTADIPNLFRYSRHKIVLKCLSEVLIRRVNLSTQIKSK